MPERHRAACCNRMASPTTHVGGGQKNPRFRPNSGPQDFYTRTRYVFWGNRCGAHVLEGGARSLGRAWRELPGNLDARRGGRSALGPGAVRQPLRAAPDPSEAQALSPHRRHDQQAASRTLRPQPDAATRCHGHELRHPPVPDYRRSARRHRHCQAERRARPAVTATRGDLSMDCPHSPRAYHRRVMRQGWRGRGHRARLPPSGMFRNALAKRGISCRRLNSRSSRRVACVASRGRFRNRIDGSTSRNFAGVTSCA